MIKSSTVTLERSTVYSSVSRVASGELKFHCCRTISWKQLPPSGDHRRVNSCVRLVSVSSNTSDTCLSLCGWSKTSRIVWTPGSAARQPAYSAFQAPTFAECMCDTEPRYECDRVTGYNRAETEVMTKCPEMAK